MRKKKRDKKHGIVFGVRINVECCQLDENRAEFRTIQNFYGSHHHP